MSGTWWYVTLDITAHAWFFPQPYFFPVAAKKPLFTLEYLVRVALLFYATMTERVDQKICIKFCQKLGDTPVETIEQIKKAFGDDAMSVPQIKKWYRRFKDGWSHLRAMIVVPGLQPVGIQKLLIKGES